MQTSKKNPFKALAGVIDGQSQKRAQQAVKRSWAASELGTIVAGGLKLDNFGPVIQRYQVLHYLTLAEPDFVNTENVAGGGGDAEFASHNHPVITPVQLLPLHVGDRVLVAPVDNGQNFIVIGRVVPGGGG